MWIVIVLCVILAGYLVFTWYCGRFANPYQLYILFGKKGVGKSTLIEKLIPYYQKRGYHLYCNIGDSSDPRITPIPIKDFLPYLAEAYKNLDLRAQIDKYFTFMGYNYPRYIEPGSVIFCDEINLLWDNRDFREFSKSTQHYFRYQRHYQHIFIGFSQTFDCDAKIRSLADVLVLVRRVFNVFIISSSYIKEPRFVKATQFNQLSTIGDDFKPMGVAYDLFKSPFRAFLPKWVGKKNSFNSLCDAGVDMRFPYMVPEEQKDP